MFLFQILIAWLLADFLTGAIHWFEDRYMDQFSLNFLNSIAEENDLHHNKPTAMTLSSGWVNMRSGAAFFASFGNLVHRWSHVPKRSLPRWIRGMQEFGLFISHEHHDAHHRSMKKLIPKHLAGYKFCPMTDWVNPVLDHIQFWYAAETIFRLAGLYTTTERRSS